MSKLLACGLALGASTWPGCDGSDGGGDGGRDAAADAGSGANGGTGSEGGAAGDGGAPQDAAIDDAGTSDGAGGGAGDGGTTMDGGGSSEGGSAGDGGSTGEGGTGDGGSVDADAGEDVGSAPNLVFVTSQLTVVSELGGLAGADARCNELAEAAGRPGNFVAWLSDSSTDAVDRLGSARGWARPDGKPVADTVADLVAGRTWYPPAVNELGNAYSGSIQVITATHPDGTKYLGPGDNCNDYQAGGTGGVRWGGTGLWGDGWTEAAIQNNVLGNFYGPVECDDFTHLYCFQVDHAEPLVPDFPASRVAFVSSGVAPNVGLSGFDAQCATDASGAGLSGTFRALVATTTASAASRFDLDGPVWAQPSGVPIVADAADIVSADPLLVPVQFEADGTSLQYITSSVTVFTGAATPNDVGVADTTCNDWSVFGPVPPYSSRGRTKTYPEFWWVSDVDPVGCNNSSRVYCLEE